MPNICPPCLRLMIYVRETDPVELFDDAARKVCLNLDGHFNQLVEVIGTHFKHPQNPGENPAITIANQ